MGGILVLNFGGQYCHLIARRVRELGVRSEVLPAEASMDDIRKNAPRGIILSGGPMGVYEKDAPKSDAEILQLGIPVLGICYGHQLMAQQTGGKVEKCKTKEYGANKIVLTEAGLKSNLFSGMGDVQKVWLSHGDHVAGLGRGFVATAKSGDGIVAGVEDAGRKLFGVQFHPEVVHTVNGKKMLENFVFKICRAEKDWHPEKLEKQLEEEVKNAVGKAKVLMGVSGGVDSTVAAAIIHRVAGKNLYCVFIDHGLLRKGETQQVREMFEKQLRFENFAVVDASKEFLDALKGVTDPEEKRKIIGHKFIQVFEREAEKLAKKAGGIAFLGQGTIYPDRIESAQPSKNAAKIKSHHNLTLPEKMNLRLVEPIKELYKDEVRALGRKIGVSKEILGRHPFPGPGLAVRIVGEVTDERLKILREADAIFIEELRKSGEYDRIWQAFAALLPVKTVGVMGDSRTYEYVIALRAVTSVDGMTADWARIPETVLERISNRIVNEVRGANRVLYDITQKPPGTIEYE